MINLITSYYLSDNEKRQEEIDRCLVNNNNSHHIKNIYLFLDSDQCLDRLNLLIADQNKIVKVRFGKQPFYSNLFEYANTLKNEICMISNSDIWLKSIEKEDLLVKLKKHKDYFYALTRHEQDLSSPLIDKWCGSHDAFMFNSPINSAIIKYINHLQNVLGSENVLLYEVKKLNYYKLYNPCRSIIIVHEHESNVHNKRIRINRGDINADGNYSIRSEKVKPSEPN